MTASGTSPAHQLQEELRTARTLLELLKEEQAQLITADIDALTALTEEKTRLVTRMSELAAERHLALAAIGFAATEAGMQAWLESRQPEVIHQSWQNLLELARAAKEVNRSNGLLIGKHLNRNQSALNVLKGGPQGQALYGPNGQSSVTAGGRGLAIG
ncbi:flagellar protein FlgN [Janthinobacterium sp. 17J80-10]|uniref:flagella synthesis protein FlgN n=1 Tax=Janthinobacterium sp. 17J80-10 TaxID=2497863 RepID=UPI001005410E|nr:flagellar protein FlgN [Janthinobacterium sp. 17J80-10]QAU34339.1 flagellar protein FlgN [Janthinobacterium sp. 17J80-10]